MPQQTYTAMADNVAATKQADPWGRFQTGEAVLLLVALILAIVGGSLEHIYMEGVGSILAWAFAYDLAIFFIKQHSVWMRTAPPPKDLGAEARAVSVIGMVHQLGVCAVLALVVLSLASSVSCFPEGVGSWVQVPFETACYPLDLATRQIFYATFGYEMKDLFHPLAWAFWVHHVFVFVGLMFCLYMNAYNGLVAMNTVVVEVGSGFANHYYYNPSYPNFLVYSVIMTLSHIFACWVAVVVWEAEVVETVYKIAFLVLAVLLILLRTIGIIIEIRRHCCAKTAADSL